MAVWKSVGGNVVVGYLGFCYLVGLRLEGNVVKGLLPVDLYHVWGQFRRRGGGFRRPQLVVESGIDGGRIFD